MYKVYTLYTLYTFTLLHIICILSHKCPYKFPRKTYLVICNLKVDGPLHGSVLTDLVICDSWDEWHFHELHWLPIYKRIVFKLLLLVYRSVNQLAPTYLCELLKPYEEVQMRDDLRSTTQHLLHIPRSGSVFFGDWSFRVAGPTEWNALPLDIKQANSIETFKSKLKTNLFKQHFGKTQEWIWWMMRDSVGWQLNVIKWIIF